MNTAWQQLVPVWPSCPQLGMAGTHSTATLHHSPLMHPCPTTVTIHHPLGITSQSQCSFSFACAATNVIKGFVDFDGIIDQHKHCTGAKVCPPNTLKGRDIHNGCRDIRKSTLQLTNTRGVMGRVFDSVSMTYICGLIL